MTAERAPRSPWWALLAIPAWPLLHLGIFGLRFQRLLPIACLTKRRICLSSRAMSAMIRVNADVAIACWPPG